jgi:hypothetical protein
MSNPFYPDAAVLFLHERTGPDGHRRLIAVEEQGVMNATKPLDGLDMTVFVPGTPWREPIQMRFPWSEPKLGSRYVAGAEFWFAQADPSDPARFSFGFVITQGPRAGVTETVDGWLNDDDTVTFQHAGRRRTTGK